MGEGGPLHWNGGEGPPPGSDRIHDSHIVPGMGGGEWP